MRGGSRRGYSRRVGRFRLSECRRPGGFSGLPRGSINEAVTTWIIDYRKTVDTGEIRICASHAPYRLLFLRVREKGNLFTIAKEDSERSSDTIQAIVLQVSASSRHRPWLRTGQVFTRFLVIFDSVGFSKVNNRSRSLRHIVERYKAGTHDAYETSPPGL